MYQCGPEWHMLQFQRMRVVSDLITLNECSQLAGAAMAGFVEWEGWQVGSANSSAADAAVVVVV